MQDLNTVQDMDPDAVPCGLLSLDDDWLILRANREVSRLTGLPPETLSGRAFEDLLSPGARVYLHLVLRPLLRMDGRADEVSLVLQAADGSHVHVLFNAQRRSGPHGMVHEVVLVHVRERKALQDKLMQAHRTTEQMPGILFRLVSEPDGRLHVPYAGKELQDLTGLSLALLAEDAAPFLARVHPADQPKLMRALSASRARLVTHPITFRLTGRAGRRYWIRAHTRAHAQGDSVVWQGALYDVTRQQQIDERLQELDKLHAVATLAAGVAHDFNNLLGSINGLAELCQLDAPSGSRQLRNLQGIVAAGQKASALVRQLLDFSHQSPSHRETLTLSDLLDRTRPLLAASLPPGITLHTEVAADSHVHIDPIQLEQCLLNLVNNAAHALRQHGGDIHVMADVAPTPPHGDHARWPGMSARLQVTDRGDGIAPELLKKIFEPFFTTKPVGEGTGLGLSAVHGVLASHGGLVTVDSAPGEGSTFTLWLPLAPAPAPAQVDPLPQPIETTP